MNQAAAVTTVRAIREEIVTMVGSGGREVSEVNDLITRLETGKCRPEAAIEQAMAIKSRTPAVSQ